jgi:hypothetical protein
LKNPSQERVGGVTQGVGPEFKPQYQKKKKNPKISLFFFKPTFGKAKRHQKSR